MATQNLSISNFKTFVFKLFIPLLGSICFLGLIFKHFFEKKIILGSGVTGAYKVNRIIHETQYNEIPIFGSSRAEGLFIPDSLGNNFFNYGIAGTQESVMIFMMQEELKKTKKSPYIIANIDLDGINPSLGDALNFIYNAGYPPVQTLLGKNYKPHHRIPFIKYYGIFETYFRYYFNAKTNLSKYINKGAYIDKTVLSSYKFKTLVAAQQQAKNSFKNDPVLTDSFLSMITTHKERFFIFVITPYHPSFFEHFVNLNDVHTFFEDLDKMPNVKVFDFSHLDYPDSLFVNIKHLNYEGALRFNSTFRDSLKTFGF